jgi:hypothetical protein
MREKAEQTFVDFEWQGMQLAVERFPLKNRFNKCVTERPRNCNFEIGSIFRGLFDGNGRSDRHAGHDGHAIIMSPGQSTGRSAK